MTRLAAALLLTACATIPDVPVEPCEPLPDARCAFVQFVPLWHDGVTLSVPVCLRWETPPQANIWRDPSAFVGGRVCWDI